MSVVLEGRRQQRCRSTSITVADVREEYKLFVSGDIHVWIKNKIIWSHKHHPW